MPSSEDILNGLSAIANEWRPLAIAWHVLFGALLLGLLKGWRSSQRLLAVVMTVPLICVGALAWMSGNPFNGAVFGALSLTLVTLGLRLPLDPVVIGSKWLAVFGAMLVAFGWFYPHFLKADSGVPYLYSGPLGLIPCPTLSVIVGMALITGMFGSRAWSIALAAVAILYGAIGVFRLGVTIDLVLLAGGIVLAAVTARSDVARRLLANRSGRPNTIPFRRHIMSKSTPLFALAVAVALTVALPFGTPFGRWTRAVPGLAAQGRQGMQTMPMSMPDMMKMHEKMMAEMKLSQLKLDDLAKRMNSASGTAKLDAMAELLNELVRQHRTMGEHMGGMHQHMMGQMK